MSHLHTHHNPQAFSTENTNPHPAYSNQTPVASAEPPGAASYETNHFGGGVGGVIPGVNDQYQHGANQPQATPPIIPGVNDPYRDTHTQPHPQSHANQTDPNVHAGIGVGPPRHPQHGGGGGGGIGSSSMAGKAQRMVGEVIGSHTMRDKGARKEKEAMQNKELAEAERLEREAAVHRERAQVHAQSGGVGRI